MRKLSRGPVTILAICLVPTFLSACIRYTDIVSAPPHSDDYSPPQWGGQRVPAIVEYKFFIGDDKTPTPNDYLKQTMIGGLRESELFSSVDTLQPSDPNQPYVRVSIEHRTTTTSISCLFFGCEELERTLNLLTILPAIFPMISAEFEAKVAVTTRNWDDIEKTYTTESKANSHWNGIDWLFEPWGKSSFNERLRYSVFNQMKRDGELYTLAPGTDKAAIVARMRAREVERQRLEQERLAQERVRQEAERARIAAEQKRKAEEQQRVAAAQREAERQRMVAAPAPSEMKPVPVVPQLDVDALPAMMTRANSHRHAVVVGIERYRQNLPAADYAVNDARVMAGYLTAVLGYPEENIAILLNDKAARTDLEKYFEGWLPNRVEKGDSVFVYFSGHGAPNPKTGKAYLVPYDGDPSFVDQTAYPLERLYDRLGKLPAKEIVVVLDSCFSGAGGRSVIAKGMRPMVLSIENPVIAGGKTAVLAASSGDQVSSTYDEKKHGLLTYYLLKGLRGEADRNQSGSIELSELFEYVKPLVERTARREFNNEQVPQLLESPELLKRGIRLIERSKP